MEAPKKIYVSIGTRQSLIARAGQTLKSDIEYIRKDALLEWAKEKKKQLLEQELTNDEPSDVAAGINAGLDMLIGKLNSM